ncbi:Toll/interleukin-1 receptor homology (TIR) domain-containing protein [Hirschfeldia incana]|nr:Toll/interleukin-1 receptor homology (TIR) domain-containing protein [Hirschfeldia incana]
MEVPAEQQPPLLPMEPPQPPPLQPVEPAQPPPQPLGFNISAFYLLLISFSLFYILVGRHSPPRPQLFVNFWGKELSNGFVSHVVKALEDAGVNVSIDSNELKGRDAETLFKRIDNSIIALVIFSDRFSESEWCLNEVVRMDKRVKDSKLRVIPVFYRVSTYDVKNFKGKFGSAFEETVQKQSPEVTNMAEHWMSSVKSVSSKAGLTSEVHSIDSSLVDAIVEDVKRQLPDMLTGNKLSILEELFFALVLAALGKFVAPLLFDDTSFFETPQWFVGVSLLVLVHRRYF